MVGKSNLKFKEWKHVKHVFISNQIVKFTLNLWRLILSQTPDCHSAQPMWNPGDSHQPSFNLGDSGNKNYFWFSAETVWYCWYSWDSRAQISCSCKRFTCDEYQIFLVKQQTSSLFAGDTKSKKKHPQKFIIEGDEFVNLTILLTTDSKKKAFKKFDLCSKLWWLRTHSR